MDRMHQRAINRRQQLDARMRQVEAEAPSSSRRTHRAPAAASPPHADVSDGGRSATSDAIARRRQATPTLSTEGQVYKQSVEGSVEAKTHNKETFIRSQLKRLGVLYSDSQISSPIHRTESTFAVETKVSNSPKPTALMARLAALADNIRQWEDDDHHPAASAKKNQEAKAGVRPMSECTVIRQSEISNTTKNRALTAPKRVTWDEKLTQKLEIDPNPLSLKASKDSLKSPPRYATETIAEGDSTKSSYSRRCKRRFSSYISPTTTSETFQNKEKVGYARKYESNLELRKTRADLGGHQVSYFSKDAKSARQRDSSSEAPCISKMDKDPLELSVSERKALFERNQGEALLPKTPFSLYSPTKYLERGLFNRVHL